MVSCIARDGIIPTAIAKVFTQANSNLRSTKFFSNHSTCCNGKVGRVGVSAEKQLAKASHSTQTHDK